MKVKSTFVLTILTILLSVFSGPIAAAAQSASPSVSAPSAPYQTYLGLVVADTPSSGMSSSGATTSNASSTLTSTSLTTSTGISSSSSSPQSADSKLIRDKVFIDMAKSRLIVLTGSPTRVEALISGYLPDPCHVLRIAIGPGITTNTINIQVYSLFDPTLGCITVLQPFSVTVSVGSFTSGQYSVYINGVLLGRFSASTASGTGTTN